MVPVPPRAAIIGTGRSGTGYMAAMLKTAGLATGHEGYWHSHWGESVSGLDVDSSWLALPHIEKRTWSGPVLHVVRHPLDTIRSLMSTGFFDLPDSGAPYPMYARAHMPQLHGRYGLAAAVEWWCEWNNRCRAVADATLRIEDAGNLMWAVIVCQTLRTMDKDIDTNHVMDAIMSTPTDVNTRGPVVDVDAATVWRLIGARAHGFGYGA